MSDKVFLDFKLCIACEDVREEKSGKHSLMGVYTGDILISAIPGHIPMSFFFEADALQTGAQQFAFRMSGPGEHSATMRAELEVSRAGPAVLKTPRVDILVDAEGTFALDVSFDDENWSPLIRKEITLNPSASVSPQQS